ncbi:MAG: TolC family protein [Desulfatiglans sp.]|nr:TolC family protein [Thermodesulfobacteriota bacterium]MEE4353618.1 TolC family protein [Desulfatiglans sp.]
MKNVISFAIILGSLSFALGCATTVKRNDYASLFAIPEKSFKEHSSSLASTNKMGPAGIITLDDALEAALERYPGLAASRHQIKARKGAAWQAGRLPNPTLSGEIEEFGGSGDYSGSDLMVSRIGISQEIPLGGQIGRRVQVAQIEADIASLQYDARTLALRTEVRKRFLRVYMLQEQLKLEKESLRLARALGETVDGRVVSGEASPLDKTKVMVKLASSEFGVERVRRELDAAKYVLASSWGQDAPGFSSVRADFQTLIELPGKTNLLKLLENNPAYGILKKKVAQSSASHELARAEGWMEIEIGGGVQHFRETDDHAYFLELSIPIPIFNRNRGRIEETRHLYHESVKDHETGLIALKTNLLETAQKLRAAQEAFLTMQNTVIPAAQKAFAAVRKAYEAGEQGYLELLEAERTLLDTRRERLVLFSELQELMVEVDALTAEALRKDPINNKESKYGS